MVLRRMNRLPNNEGMRETNVPDLVEERRMALSYSQGKNNRLRVIRNSDTRILIAAEL